METPRLIKVQLSYENGEIRELEGNIANEWSKSVSNCCIMSAVHGSPMEDFKWKIVWPAKTRAITEGKVVKGGINPRKDPMPPIPERIGQGD